MKQKWIEAFMDTADRFAQLSSAKRLQVGAVVVKDERITSIGYNGTPAGWDNTCEFTYTNPQSKVSEIVTKPEVIHAEANAISKLAKSSESGAGASIFITHAPCVECAKLIYGAGIKHVYYRNSYRSEDGLNFLVKCNIETEKV